MKATVDTHIRFDENELDDGTLNKVLSYLTIPNPAKARAESELVWNAQNLPDTIELWELCDGEYILPRGFIHEFEHILREAGVKVFWDSNMTDPHDDFLPHWNVPISLRDYQLDALETLDHYKCGIYKAPTGSGKTRVMLALIGRTWGKALIIIEKKELLHQWKKAAEELGFKSIGVIGGGKFESDKELVLATRQSLWANYQDRGSVADHLWCQQFQVVIVDECHHVASETMWELVQRFPAYHRFGCSATPDSDPEIFPIARAILGPIIHDTTTEQAEDALVIPSIRVVNTNFEFEYYPTERVWIKSKRQWGIRRNNYGAMMESLESNFERNKLIAKHIMREANSGKHCLVLSKRKNHLSELTLALQLYSRHRFIDVFTIIGDNSTSDRIREKVAHIKESKDPCIIFSTLADEGTDIPILDRLFLAYPGRKLRGFEQAIGRIMRKHHLKDDAIVYDFRDPNVSLLKSQYRDRAQMIYTKRGYNVEISEQKERASQ